eukprot:GFUD01009110.1.p1 GENE.GFUD01009110.1~~GFUD01009110.1.p1  ORF type:complete len:2320 (+),score=595.04 GFUD01009110.1:230-7189(+)
MYGRGRSRGGTASRSLDRSETSSTRSGTKLKLTPLTNEKPKAKLESEKNKVNKNTPTKSEKPEGKKEPVKPTEGKKETVKQKAASPATPFGFKSRASSRSPARGAGQASPARGKQEVLTASRAKGPLKIPSARSVSPKGSPANKAKTKQGKVVKAKTSTDKQAVENQGTSDSTKQPGPSTEEKPQNEDSVTAPEKAESTLIESDPTINTETNIEKVLEVVETKPKELSNTKREGKPSRGKRQRVPRLNDNPEAPEVVDVPNMRSSLGGKPDRERDPENGIENDLSSSKVENLALGVTPAATDESDKEVAFSTKMPLIADEDKSMSVNINTSNSSVNDGPGEMSPNSSEESKSNSCSAGPISQLKPLAVSPLRSVPQSPNKFEAIVDKPIIVTNAVSDSSESHDIVGANKSEFPSVDVKENIGNPNETNVVVTKDFSVTNSDISLNGSTNSAKDIQGDILTRMIRENLNKAVKNNDDSLTDGNAADMKKSLLDVIKNTLKSSKVKVDDTGFHADDKIKKINIHKTESDTKMDSILGEIIANGNIINGDREPEKGEEKENKNELMETGDISDGLLQNLVDVLSDKSPDSKKRTGPKNLLKKQSLGDVAIEVEHSPKKVITSSPNITVLSPVTNMSVCGDTLMSSSDGINDFVVDQPTSVPVPEIPGTTNGPITLDQLEQGMVPVDSIQIEHIEADGTTTKINSMQLADVPGVMCDDTNIAVVVMDEEADNQKAKFNIDKTKLFSQMNDTFAKDTHNALKHRPVYQKRNRQLPSPDISGAFVESLSPPNKKKKSKDRVEGKSSKQSISKGKDKPEFTIGASVIDDEIMNTPEIETDIVNEDPESVKVSDCEETSNNNGEEQIRSEGATESEDNTNMIIDTDTAHTSDNTETDVEDSIENDTNEGKSNLQPISDEILKCENMEESIKDIPVTEENKVISDVTEEVEDKNSDPNNSDNVPEMSLSDSVEHNIETMDFDVKDMDNESAENAETEDENCDITETLDLDESVVIPTRTLEFETINDISLKDPDTSLVADANVNSEVDPPSMPGNNSDLTKSLRRVRLAKKSPTKTPIKEKWEHRDLSPTSMEISSPTKLSSDDLVPQTPTLTSPLMQVTSTPHAELTSAQKAGTEVFDFTDDEDIPLSNIDLDVLNAANTESTPLQISIPEPTASFIHELNQMTPKPSPSKLLSKRFEVSPQILTAMDAVAAVQALQTSPVSAPAVPMVKLNGDVMSDDTDTSVSIKTMQPTEKGKLTKRKKRRVPESDGGETEDDLEHQKKESRPKRIKNVSGTPSADSSNPAPSASTSVQIRPCSAASGASITSFDKKDFEEKKVEDQDGKQTPDSQKSMDDKTLVKAFSTVVPEKASSFKIHPERTCGDCCFYCGLKFGMLDTPLHIKQLKTNEKQEFAMEFTGFDRDACLCDRCFRFLDRRAQAKNMNGAKNVEEPKEPKEEKVKKCIVRTCNRQVTNSVSKKWLIRLKKRLIKKIGLDWDKVSKASVKATFPICGKHNILIDFYSNCGLCKRKLSVGGICTLGMTTKEVEEMNILLREDHIPADLKENNFVCKLCKTFCGIKQKSLQPDYLKNHKTHKAFYKDYRRKLYIYLELGEDDKSDSSKLPKKLFKVSQSDSGSCKITISAHTPDMGEKKKKKEKDFSSPSDESKIQVDNDTSNDAAKDSEAIEKCAVNINFDLNTKKLWQDLHYPYGNYTSFFRHLILLEKYWRSGDLSLSNNASVKASSYLKSVQNRIKTYEGKQVQSDADLSANTRPDLEAPPAPALIHIPGEAVLANLPDQNPSPKLDVKSPESTILRIPKVPQPRATSSLLSPDHRFVERPSSTSPTPKIRVRQDLMAHLGLVAKNSANIVQHERSVPGHLRAALSVTSTSQASSTPNLAKLLSEGNPKQGSDVRPPDAALLAPTIKKSSNSQLFKSTESSGAIPLTFNNSIAEVLAAASKAKANRSREPSPKPEITITAKSASKGKDMTQLLDVRSLSSNKIPKIDFGGHKLPASIHSPSPSGGGLSILKKTVASSSSNVNPISNMTKLLQTQAPGLPPHIIAQQALPARSTPKVMSKPPGPVMSNLRPVQISSGKPTGIQTVNKKSLNTVLDRLGGLGTTSSPLPPKQSHNLSSSLVQQLQAPPMTSRPQSTGARPGPKSYKEAKAQIQKALGNSGPPQSKAPESSPQPKVSMSSNMNSGRNNLGNMMVPSSMAGMPIGQPMVQFPSHQLDPSNLMNMNTSTANLLSQFSTPFSTPNAAAAQAALMMAGFNGLSTQQAQQAMQELLQQQHQLMQQQHQHQQQQQGQPRMRAPPPLKNMSGRGPNLGAKQE